MIKDIDADRQKTSRTDLIAQGLLRKTKREGWPIWKEFDFGGQKEKAKPNHKSAPNDWKTIHCNFQMERHHHWPIIIAARSSNPTLLKHREKWIWHPTWVIPKQTKPETKRWVTRLRKTRPLTSLWLWLAIDQLEHTSRLHQYGQYVFCQLGALMPCSHPLAKGILQLKPPQQELLQRLIEARPRTQRLRPN